MNTGFMAAVARKRAGAASGLASRDFDGGNDYVSVGTTSSFNFIHETGVFSISVWVKIPSPDADDFQVIASSMGGSSANRGFLLDYENRTGTGDHQFRILLYRGVASTTVVDLFSTVDSISDNGWHHLAVTGDGTNFAIYVDGAESDTGTAGLSYGSGNAATALYLGRMTSYYGEQFLADARIYNTTLTPAQILALYNGGSITNNLVGHWLTNADDVLDYAGSNDGTNSGSTYSTVGPRDPYFLDFSGTSQAVDYGVDQVDVDGVSVVLFCRVKFDSLAQFRLWDLRGTGAGGSQRGIQFSVSGSASTANNCYIDNASASVNLDNVTHGLSTGTWYDLALTFDTATGKLAFWRDASEIGSRTSAAFIGEDLTSGREVRFGAASNDVAAQELNGQAMNARVYTSANTITSDDMADIFAGTTPSGFALKIDTPYNDGEGTQADDRSGNFNHGTFKGSPTWVQV